MTDKTGSPSAKSKIKWTEEQLDAITTRGRNLLVSAAAGAGKTAVLVERVVYLLTRAQNPVDIDELLVVTFTDAAASEMRDRIARALEEELDSNPGCTRLAKQLALVSRADISTIHSFCHRIIRQYFYRLGIDPAFRVMDDVESQLLELEVIDELFESFYDDPLFADAFTDLIDRYGGRRGDERVKDLALRVYEFSRSRPDPNKWLSRLSSMFSIKADTSIYDLHWAERARQGVIRKAQMAYRSLERAVELAGMPGGPSSYLELLRAEMDSCSKILEACTDKDWEGLARQLSALEFARLPSAKPGSCDEDLKSEAQARRNEARDLLKGLKEDCFSRPPQELVDDIRAIAQSMQTFVHAVKEFAKAYTAAKREKSLVDFNDLEHLCLEVLREPDEETGGWTGSDVAKELQERYKEILVDEYQDINPVQNEILSLVSSPGNSFMVGDVKQSIYRFRLAEPRLFMEKHREYPKGDATGDSKRIDLAKNFRSRQSVIDFVNFIFRQVFSQGVGEIDYDADAELVAGYDYPAHDTGLFRGDIDNPPVEVYLVDRGAAWDGQVSGDVEDLPGRPGDGSPGGAADKDTDRGWKDEDPEDLKDPEDPEDLETLEVEGRLIARRIAEMVRGTTTNPGPEFQVWDKERKAYRPVSYRDIVVLMRATKARANVLMEVFRQADIPAYAELGTGYFEAVEVETMLSLLRIIDNPRQDIPLAAVLRSPLVGFSPDELAKIRLCSKDNDFYHALETAPSELEDVQLASKVAGFLERLESWRTVARRVPLSALVWQLYRDTGYFDYVGGMPGGVQRQANLRAFHERARQFDRFSRQGLVRFLRFIDRLREAEGDLGTARALGETEDVVRIMSIHKSKGLEFPVVFIPDMGKEFNMQDLKGDILFHSEEGLGPVYSDFLKRIKYPTIAYHGVREARLKETISEEMRVLYVAMTRARERLILVGSDKDLTKAAAEWRSNAPATGWGLPEDVLYSARRFLDWVGPCLVRHKNGARIPGDEDSGRYSADPVVYDDLAEFTVSVLSVGEACSGFENLTDSGLKGADIDWNLVVRAHPLGRQPNPELWQEIQAHASWQYPYSPLAEKASKVAWAEIKRRFDFSTEDAELSREDAFPAPPEQGRLAPPPGFLQSAKITPSERGEATHLVIQHLDLKGPLDVSSIEESIETMVDAELLTGELAREVDVRSISDFFESSLGRRVTADPDRVMREVPFSLGIPAARVYPELSGLGEDVLETERVLVQGIIDCIIDEDDGFVLIDFKTGGRPGDDPEAIAGRYLGQILVYKEALETIYKKPVKEAYIYLLSMRKAILIT